MTPSRGASPGPGARRATLVLPDPSLVLLIGAAGAGKTTFAARRFAPDEVLSTDALRAALTGDPSDQSRNRLVFALLHREAERRMGAGLLTVIDATNVEWHARRPLLGLAGRTGRPAVAIVLDLSLDEVVARNARRTDGAVPVDAVERHHRRLRAAIERGALAREGFHAVHRLEGAGAIEGAIVVRVRADEVQAVSPRR